MSPFRARRDLPEWGIRKGDRVDRDHEARRGDPDAWISEGSDYRQEIREKGNRQAAERRERRKRGG